MQSLHLAISACDIARARAASCVHRNTEQHSQRTEHVRPWRLPRFQLRVATCECPPRCRESGSHDAERAEACSRHLWIETCLTNLYCNQTTLLQHLDVRWRRGRGGAGRGWHRGSGSVGASPGADGTGNSRLRAYRQAVHETCDSVRHEPSKLDMQLVVLSRYR